MAFNDDLLKYTKAEENLLRTRLEAIRAAVPPPNRAEKGRSVELAVRQFFRDVLPGEYGLTTGFVAYHTADCIEESIRTEGDAKHYLYRYRNDRDIILVSSQLDLIIYDAVRFGPIMRLEGCDVLPFEAVYAYVEVKSWIGSRPGDDGLTPLQSILRQSNLLRDIKVRLYWISEPGKYTRSVLMPYPLVESIPIRALVFILDTDKSLGDFPDILATLNAPAARSMNGFISSMYIQDKGYFRSHHAETSADPQIGSFEGTPGGALAVFKIALLSGLSRFPRAEKAWTPALDRYYSNDQVPSAEVELLKRPNAPAEVTLRIPTSAP